MANKELFNGHKYTFNKVSGSLILLDSTDNSHETTTFRVGMDVSGSGIKIKGDSTGMGLTLYAHNENQKVAELVASNDDSQFNMYRNGANAFYVQAGAANYADFVYAKSYSTTDSYNIAKFVNGSNLLGLQIRSDGRLYSHGANLWLFDSGGSNYIKLFKSGEHAYLDAASSGHVYLRPNGGTTRFLAHATSAQNVSYGDIRPSSNNTYDVGTSSKKWDNVYATSGTVNSSDANLKEHISGSNLGLSFINRLRPVSYKWKNGGVRPHYGLIAQEVSSSLAAEGVHTDNFAGYIKNDIYTKTEISTIPDDANPDSNTPIQISESVDYSLHDIQKNGYDVNDFTFVSSSLGLRYAEFISPLIKAVQELSTKVTSLEARITELENN